MSKKGLQRIINPTNFKILAEMKMFNPGRQRRSCENCRHHKTDFAYCKRWEWIKKRYFREHERKMRSEYCPFWAYKPKGLWK